MRTDLAAYTGPHPESGGFVGFVNVSRVADGQGIMFTVRSEGVEPVLASYAIPVGEAKKLLSEALDHL